MDNEGKAIPVSDTPERAMMLLYPNRDKGYFVESMTNLLTLDTASLDNGANFNDILGECGGNGVNFFKYKSGIQLDDRTDAGNLTYSFNLDYIHHLSYMGCADEHFNPYYRRSLKNDKANLKEILYAF
jgi:hypothetical protein